jgi:hypothetical protein
MWRFLFSITTGLSTIWAAEAQSAEPALPPAGPLAAFSAGRGDAPPPAWRAVGLPGGKVPLSAMLLDHRLVPGAAVLRLASTASYGTLVHDLPLLPAQPQTALAWRWRLDQPVPGADLRQRAGDDAAVKLCVMFDQPLSRLSLGERSLLRLARTVSGEALPAATLCYVWDPQLPAGTVLANAYTRRMRWLVVDGSDSPLGQWREHRRPIAADFQRAFGDESPSTPPMTAVVVGTDSDNTGGRSLAFVGDVKLSP